MSLAWYSASDPLQFSTSSAIPFIRSVREDLANDLISITHSSAGMLTLSCGAVFGGPLSTAGNDGGLAIPSGVPAVTADTLYNNAGVLMWNGDHLLPDPPVIPEVPIIVSASAPVDPPARYVWVQTGLGDSGDDFTFWVEDGQ